MNLSTQQLLNMEDSLFNPNDNLPADSVNSSNVSSSIIKFVDLFAGLGGTRIGFEQACSDLGFIAKCVFTSEIKQHAVSVYKDNFPGSDVHGDITKQKPQNIPDFDYLLAGFPCQPFSSAGKRHGFMDERGGLFFVIHEILKVKSPAGFLLENVDGLANHDNGETLRVIISKLESLNYQVSYNILNSADFGVPQNRKRIYIVGHKKFKPDLSKFIVERTAAGKFIDHSTPVNFTKFTKMLSEKFTPEKLYGKSLKDKRGGSNNIHSWDLELKGKINTDQKELLELLLKKRRSKKWAENKGIDWMDGMPLTLDEIRTFYDHPDMLTNLEDLVEKGYLKFEHPKKKVFVNGVSKRIPHTDAPKGYNIVTGKLSLPLSMIINPSSVAPTIVATEAGKIGVATEKGVRPITIREGLCFSGFPESYNLNLENYNKAFDLIGNTVMPPVIKAVALRLLRSEKKNEC